MAICIANPKGEFINFIARTVPELLKEVAPYSRVRFPVTVQV
jgi:hypothetical protein